MRTNTVFKKQAITADEKKITTEKLIEYIKKNSEQIQSIDFVDLNPVKEVEVKELKKLQFQDVRTIKFLPSVFDTFFNLSENKYLHAGVLEKVPSYNEINISLFSSIIVCLRQSFLSQNLPYQQKFISSFIDCLRNDSRKFNYQKYNWGKNDLYDCIQKGFIGSNIIKYLSDYLCINIFVLSMEDQRLMFGGGDEYVPYKKTIFLIHYEGNTFEPMYTEHTKFFSCSDDIIKTIRSNKNQIKAYKLHPDMNTSLVESDENMDTYYHKPVPKEKKDEKKKEEEVEVEEETVTYTLKELKTMKLSQIQEIAESLKIKTKNGNKNRTKDQMISDILSN